VIRSGERGKEWRTRGKGSANPEGGVVDLPGNNGEQCRSEKGSSEVSDKQRRRA
jgi:hypothetical protein